MKRISDELNLNNKKILLRLDLNVPLTDDKITDTTRIDKILPTLKFLISQNTKIIIISHASFGFNLASNYCKFLLDCLRYSHISNFIKF